MSEAAAPQTPSKGWKTATVGYLTAAYAIIAIALYFISGPGAAGALSPSEAIPLALGGFGLVGLGDKIQKLIASLK